MVVLVVGRVDAVVLGLAHIKLAAEDGLYAVGLCRVKEVDSPVDVAVVGHGHGLLTQRSHALSKFGDVARAVQKRVLGVQMEVGEFGHDSSRF